MIIVSMPAIRLSKAGHGCALLYCEMRYSDKLYALVCSYDTLVQAYHEVAKGKRYDYDFEQIDYQIAEVLVDIHNDLINKTYMPGRTIKFIDPGPPPRNITCPDLRDRIVHTAIKIVIYPYLEKYFDYDSYACRDGKGTLKACLRLQQFYRSAIGAWGHRNFYVIKGDFKKFFPSMSHDFAVFMYQKLFKDDDLVGLMEKIIRYYDGAEELFEYGEPIGFLTTQHSGNLVGTALDHFVKSMLKCRYYLRLTDDFRILVQTKEEAEVILEKIEWFVSNKMMQTLSPTKTKIVRAKPYDVFCGYKIFPHHLEPKTATERRSERRIRKKLRSYNDGIITLKELEDTCDSFRKSYLKHTSIKSNPVLEEAYAFIALKKAELGIEDSARKHGKEMTVLPVRAVDW